MVVEKYYRSRWMKNAMKLRIYNFILKIIIGGLEGIVLGVLLGCATTHNSKLQAHSFWVE